MIQEIYDIAVETKESPMAFKTPCSEQFYQQRYLADCLSEASADLVTQFYHHAIEINIPNPAPPVCGTTQKEDFGQNASELQQYIANWMGYVTSMRYEVHVPCIRKLRTHCTCKHILYICRVVYNNTQQYMIQCEKII